MAILNPTDVNAGNPQFGSSSQFNIAPFMKPFDYAGQNADSTAYVDKYTAAIPKQRGQIEANFGLPLMRSTYQRGNEVMDDMQAALFGMPKQVADTSRESLLTEGQKQNLIQSKSDPIQKNLAQFSIGQGRLGQTLNAYEGLADKQLQENMLPFEKEFDLLTQQQAREFSGYTFSNQQELNRLVQNQQAGLTWTNSEAERANRLAIQEMQYKQTMDSIREQGNQARMTKKAPTDLATLWSSMMR